MVGYSHSFAILTFRTIWLNEAFWVLLAASFSLVWLVLDFSDCLAHFSFWFSLFFYSSGKDFILKPSALSLFVLWKTWKIQNYSKRLPGRDRSLLLSYFPSHSRRKCSLIETRRTKCGFLLARAEEASGVQNQRGVMNVMIKKMRRMENILLLLQHLILKLEFCFSRTHLKLFTSINCTYFNFLATFHNVFFISAHYSSALRSCKVKQIHSIKSIISPFSASSPETET